MLWRSLRNSNRLSLVIARWSLLLEKVVIYEIVITSPLFWWRRLTKSQWKNYGSGSILSITFGEKWLSIINMSFITHNPVYAFMFRHSWSQEVIYWSSETLNKPRTYTLRKLVFHFLSNWMGYDRGDSFPFDIEPNGIPFGSKSKGKLSPRSYPIQCERKWKYSFLSVRQFFTSCFVRGQGCAPFETFISTTQNLMLLSLQNVMLLRRAS